MNTGHKLTVGGIVLGVILQCLTFAYFYGRLSQRVDSVKETTDKLLQLQLDKSAKGY